MRACCSACLALTHRNILKLFSWQPLRQSTNVELNRIRVLISLNTSHRDPKKQLFGLNSRHTGHRPIAQLSVDFLVIVDQLVKLHVTWVCELDAERSVVGESVGFDVVWDETLREAVLGEEVMDVGDGSEWGGLTVGIELWVSEG